MVAFYFIYFFFSPKLFKSSPKPFDLVLQFILLHRSLFNFSSVEKVFHIGDGCSPNTLSMYTFIHRRHGYSPKLKIFTEDFGL